MRTLRTLLGLAGLFACGQAAAIVDMESLHLGAPKPGFSGRLEFAAAGSSGNSETGSVELGTRLQWHRAPWTNYLLLDGAYGESRGKADTEKYFVHARHIHAIIPRLDWELFVQGEHDRFARLNFRGLAGGGLRTHLYEREDSGMVLLGTGAFYSAERISGGYSDAGTYDTTRGNLYLVLKFAVSPNTTLLSSTYYQPDLADGADYRALEQAALQVKITKALALKLSLHVTHDSRPPLSVRSTDTSYKAGISWAF